MKINWFTYKALFKGILLTLLLSVGSTAFAENSIIFLGQDTGIVDREIRNNGILLSTILDNKTRHCANKAARAKFKKPKNADKKRLNIQVKCLRKEIKHLSHKHYHHHHDNKRKHKHKIVTMPERKILNAIIKEFKKNGGGIIVDPPEIEISTINGRVTTPAGDTISGVSVTVDQGLPITTQADGTFSLELEANTEHVLTFNATGFATQVTPVKAPSENGVITLDFTMIQRGEVQTVSATSGGIVTGSDGASVDVQPNSFVDASGNAVIGDIQLTITPVDVSNSATLGAFPGEFTGIQTDATETPIISFGTVEYKFTQNGAPLQLAANTTADILIPIYISTYQDGSDIQIGDFIPLWSLNEDTGIWLQEGEGQVVASSDSPTGLAMRATVSHFTWWNCDVSMNAAKAIVTVIGSQAGTAVIQATTTANIGGRPNTVDATTDVGVATQPLNIPSNGEVCFTANITYVDGTTGSTPEECVNAAPNSTVNITLIAPVPGPLDIVANASNGPITVNAIVGFGYPIGKVNLNAITAETNVAYSVTSGALPAGISLNTTSATTAEIVGVPTTAGSFSVVVQGTNATETDAITINFTISDPSTSETPIFINDRLYFSMDFVDQYDLNPYNVGGLSTNWTLIPRPDTEMPTWITLDASTGILSVVGPRPVYDNWVGTVRAANSAGSAETVINFCTGDCVGGSTPIPGDYALRISNAFQNEARGDMSFHIELNQPSATDITVSYATADSSPVSAIADVDYTSTAGTVTIPAGDTTATIVVPMIDDLIPEGFLSETFLINLSNPVGARIENGSATGHISDNDSFEEPS